MAGCDADTTDPGNAASDAGSDAGHLAACRPAGCSGELCADQDVASNCLWLEEFACYTDASCERQADGACAWNETAELTQCIEDARAGLTWFTTCGAPACGPGSEQLPGLDDCIASADQVEGAPCSNQGASCNPGAGCGVRLTCAATDPKTGPGGCPVSRARFKHDIAYVGEHERAGLAAELHALPLATYRLRDGDGRLRLGFILEDVEPSLATDGQRDRVDLYGYTSLAVAAIQEQARRIEALESELHTMRGHLLLQCGDSAAH